MKKIFIQIPGAKYLVLDPGAVILAEADRQLCYFALTDGSRVMATQHLGYYKTGLIEHFGFWEISKSSLVNRDHVVKYEPRERLLTLSNGVVIDLPQKRVELLNKIFFKTLQDMWKEGQNVAE